MSMKPLTSRAIGAVAIVTSVALALVGCGGSSDKDSAANVDPNAAVTIGVGNKPTSEEPDQVKLFDRRLKEFEAKYPNITVEPEETKWAADTFNALLAGGQLPTVFTVPFTEMQGLIAREQVADLSQYVEPFETLNNLNPTLINQVKGPDGQVYGVPTSAYSMGLVYNRALFTKAGLDPDKPPTTWEEVRADAKAITDKTDAQGFATLTRKNQGGWILTTTSYAHGQKVESDDGTLATVDNEATAKVLDMYKAMRWEDNSMGDNFLLDITDMGNAFSAGKIGMNVLAPDVYTQNVITNGMSKDDFGLAPLPQTEAGIGTLGGGSIAIVQPTATPEEIAAGLKWIDFVNFQKYGDEAAAVADAKSTVADGTAIGVPSLPLFTPEIEDRYQGWIKPYVNVPRENFTGYLNSTQTLPLVPEPPVKAQELYASLDPVVQAVLTRQDADIATLLAAAQKTVQAAIDAG